MDIILIAGLWLDADCWARTATQLESLGHRAIPVMLPGQGDGNTHADLDDQLAAVLAAVDAAERPMVVGHSAASTLAWLAADRRPEAVRRAVLIGGFPSSDGAVYADFFEVVDGAMPFPGWDVFEGPDAADLDEPTRRRMAEAMIPVPEGVAHGVVRLHDERRFGVPVTLVCPEFGPDDARAWVASGDLPELASAEEVSYVDLDSGHWPMVTRPADLAEVLGELAGSRT